MITGNSTRRVELSTNRDGSGGLLGANQVADAIKEQWRKGGAPDVAAALAGHPELRCYRTVVLDLAYQEYQHRLQTGESIDAETFSQRFPSFQRSLHLYIAVNGFVSQDPDYRDLTDPASWPEPGQQFLQFSLIAEIGRGSFGRVFLATEPALGGRTVIVKVAPHGGEEADVLGKLRHANIVPVYSLQEDETGLTAFCMPYLGRATLCDVLDGAFAGRHPPERASIILDAVAAANDHADLDEPAGADGMLCKGSYVNGILHLGVQLADALAHAHGRGICHRDLKPSNVLMAPDGRPLLLDFNLSVDQRMQTARIGGTVPYMAPEELAVLIERSQESARRLYDPRSDLFSLGVVLYELLTGELPFGAIPADESLDDLARRLYSRQKQGPHSIRELNHQVDSRLARLIESCLAFEPDRRPETVQRLADALRAELAPVRRMRRWIGNHRRLVGSLAATSLALIVAVAAFFALRAPYSVREYRLGLAEAEQGNHVEAVNHLNNAILWDRDSTEAYFARARSYQQLGEFQTAYQDFAAAYRLSNCPLYEACKGYCLNQMDSPRPATALYQSALKMGYDSPALLYNNLGYCYLTLRQLDEAQKYLELAIQADGELQSPHYHMVWLLLRRSNDGRPLSEKAFAHAAKALAIGPCTADLYFTLAELYSAAAQKDPKCVQPTIEYVGKAVEMGIDPKRFSVEPNFIALRHLPAFQEALRRPAVTSSPPKTAMFLDPVTKR